MRLASMALSGTSIPLLLEIVKREASATSKGKFIIQPAETYHSTPGDSVLGEVVGKYILVHLVNMPTNVGS
jgi:hypothetical protein